MKSSTDILYFQWNAAHGATNARLNHFAGNGKKGAWTALFNEQGHWIEVDLGHITKVTKIGTQGRHDYAQWVTEYKVYYSFDGGYFEFYKHDPNGDARVSLEEKPQTECIQSFKCIFFILLTLLDIDL